MKKNGKLKLVLFEKGITQQELAAKTGIPCAYISQCVNGRFLLNRDQREKIAEVLGVSVTNVFQTEKDVCDT